MCGRFTQERPTSELAEIFDAEDRAQAPGGRFNVAPTDQAAVVVQRDETRAITAFRWGLVPHWADSARVGNRMFNARAETLSTSPAFRAAMKKRRCLVPVDSFYEWRRDGKARQPFRVVRSDGRPLALAGLWAGWHDPETEEVRRTFTIVTTTPNDLMRPIHNRMPVVLPPEAWDRWLDPELPDPGELTGLLVPAEDGALDLYPVSRAVNDVRNDGPGLILPMEEPLALFGEPTEDPEG
ncbi:MAG: SOS response-associated peptidase [Candidatus Limnocylindrales bacterium]